MRLTGALYREREREKKKENLRHESEKKILN